MSSGFMFSSMTFFVISCFVIVYGHHICCLGHGVYRGLGYITMGGLVLRSIYRLFLSAPYVIGSIPSVSMEHFAWCACGRACGVAAFFAFPVQDPVHHLDGCAMRICPGVPVGHPWVWYLGRGSGWGSSGSILGGRVCTGVFGEGIAGDVASNFCMRCLAGVRNVEFCAGSAIWFSGVGHSSSIRTGGVSFILGGGRSTIVDL